MTCSIVTVDRQLTAVVKATVPFPEIPKARENCLDRLWATRRVVRVHRSEASSGECPYT